MKEADLHALVTGTVLRLLRERQGLTQLHLARRAGLTQRDLSRLETGGGRLDLLRAAHVSKALGLREEDLRDRIRDAWARAERAAMAAIEVKGAWSLIIEQAVGEEGTRCLVRFAAAAALHPWPERNPC